jgi:SlyX protein
VSPDDEISRLQTQLVELQTQVAFQEDTISDLNTALASQQLDLTDLRRQCELMRQQMLQEQVELQAQLPGSDGDEKPPHY